MGDGAQDVKPRFGVGARVHVRLAYPPGHVRTPYFARGRTGVVDAVAGRFRNPEDLAYGRYDGPLLTLYRVRFRQTDLWPRYAGPGLDTAIVDIYENWLEPAGEGGDE